MPPVDRKEWVQRRMLGLLADHGLPFPDEIEFDRDEVTFLWSDRKVALIVELDSPGEFDGPIPESIAC